MSLRILGIGTEVPEHSLPQGEIAEIVSRVTGAVGQEQRTLSGLFRRAGVRRRGSVLLGNGSPWPDGVPSPGTSERMRSYDLHAIRLAAGACRRAIEESGVPARAITHLVTASCTGFAAPGVDCGLVDDLGLPRTVERTHVGFMGCHAALNALRVATAFAGADPAARILVCCVELCSLHLRDASDPSALVSSSLFADGAGAIVGAAGDGPWAVRYSGSLLSPGTEAAMGWRIGDRGFEMSLSPEVPELIEERAKPWIMAWLDRAGLAPADVGSWAIHPGGPRILTAVEKALGLENGAARTSREVLADHGNMSSATVIFVLERLRAAGAPLPCVALGFGPGLTCEATLLR